MAKDFCRKFNFFMNENKFFCKFLCELFTSTKIDVIINTVKGKPEIIRVFI